MSAVHLMRANCERLLAQYNSNIQDIVILQTVFIRDILPSIADELELSPEATEWAREWLEDTNTLFRISRRNNFTRSFAMESIRKNLVWRMGNVWPLMCSASTPLSMVHSLPENARDPFGRPILLLKPFPLDFNHEEAKPIIIETFERLRCHLRNLNKQSTAEPVLQYIILLDIQDFPLKYLDLDLFTWTLREIIPKFSGMLGGVFLLNYSWVHAGMWSVIKRILPENAISRVFFPSSEDLIQYFTPESLPQEYGGALPALWLLNDPLRMQKTEQRENLVNDTPSSHSTSIPPTSRLNPFYGYPASLAFGFWSLHHGRRRKRDLARTLILLFWIRWRKSLIVGFLIAICTLALKLGSWRAIAQHLQLLFRRYLLEIPIHQPT